MRKLFASLVLFATLFPAAAFGATFAKQTLFLSKESVTEGETVLIHTIVSNEATTSFAGKLEITNKEGSIGTVPVALAAGEAAAVSVSWKPLAGSHSITAQLLDQAGKVVEKESATFTIHAKAVADTVTPETATTDVDSSEEIQQALANLSPAVAETSEPVFNAIDSARAQAAEVLDRGVAWSKKQIGTSAIKNRGTILGTETEKSTTEKISSSAWTIVATVVLYVLSILRHLVSSAGIFYPLFALLFFFMLWKLYRRFSRRR
jgi:hypothetical protein